MMQMLRRLMPIAAVALATLATSSPAAALEFEETDVVVDVEITGLGSDAVLDEEDPVVRIGRDVCQSKFTSTVTFSFDVVPTLQLFESGTPGAGELVLEDLRLFSVDVDGSFTGECDEESTADCVQMPDEAENDLDVQVDQTNGQVKLLTTVKALAALADPQLLPSVDACTPDDGSAMSTQTQNLDAGTTDTGTADTGTSDTGTSDTGTSDTGTADTGTADTGTADTGTSDAGTTDTGMTGDVGGDTGGGGQAGAGFERAFYVRAFFERQTTVGTTEIVLGDAVLIVDLARPPAPAALVSATASENTLAVAWNPPSPDQDVDSYWAFWSTDPALLTAEYPGDVSANRAKLRDRDPDDDPAEVLEETTDEVSAAPGERLYVAVASRDEAGNFSRLVPTADGAGVPVLEAVDFWEAYKRAGGTETGGCTSAAPASAPGGLPAAAVGVILLGLWTRRRRR